MDLILDTHTLIWTLLADSRIGEQQRQMINAIENRIFVSSVSAFEMAIKVRIGKLVEATTLVKDFEKICSDFGFAQLPVTHAHGLAAGNLAGTHRDPFDRLLAAQSIVERISIMTVDARLRDLGAEVVW
jgi:PIN domain nuclease of toxin-antitoxin system